MMKRVIVLCLAVLFVLGIAAMAYAGPKYVGADKCKGCHKGEKNGEVFEKWLESKHAKAFDLLKGDEQKNPKCLACHTTGYGKETEAAPEALHGVQCEACHGPGAEYKSKKVMEDKKAAQAAGLLIPNAKTCTDNCHNKNSPNFKEFDFDKSYAKIKHLAPKK